MIKLHGLNLVDLFLESGTFGALNGKITGKAAFDPATIDERSNGLLKKALNSLLNISLDDIHWDREFVIFDPEPMIIKNKDSQHMNTIKL